MAIQPEHEIHRRRWSRNLGLGLVLGAFVVLVFGLTIVKVSRQDEHGNPPGAEASQ
ncbi:hypothetical protein [Albidovulum sp.]|uniref:hypothetical protein n=1 Tax=Albidovulum sp. TaxID=1872424 RepID=UPI001DF31FFF|nr:hypothetical protein [Paracoccaceae bacterium]MCC0047083.1 hypothetical protein [Defluviimonas sp.]HPE26214.1 hypothetical protein [Albidovulum sp.]MCB2121859.1 hypothetical protein [Paracoccaceae bacterium]MCB2134270.1 hypothetical protein [Paracoccaceae bacterium]